MHPDAIFHPDHAFQLDPRLGLRLPTFQSALDTLTERHGTNIVETGCARMTDNWEGDGQSTVLLGRYAHWVYGHLWTVDADPGNLQTARDLTTQHADHITYVHDDSVHFLEGHAERIDLLYLDSFDYPLNVLLDLHGGQDDLEGSVAHLRALGDDLIVSRYWDIIGDSQRHAEREIIAALPKLHDGSLVLIDDADLPGGGKARLAKLALTEAGWTCRMDMYQTLWSKV